MIVSSAYKGPASVVTSLDNEGHFYYPMTPTSTSFSYSIIFSRFVYFHKFVIILIIFLYKV